MNFIQNLSTRERVLLIVLFVLMIGYGSYTFILQPFFVDRAALLERKMLLEERLQYFSRMEEGLQNLNQQHQLASQAIELFKVDLISINEIPMVLRMLREHINRENLEVVVLNPKNVQRRDQYSTVPIDLTVMGGYEDMVFFLDRLNNHPYIIDIEHIAIRYEGLYNDPTNDPMYEPFVVLRMELNLLLYLTRE